MEQTTELSVWEKLVRADNSRKTRFHDQKGNVIDMAALPYMPLAYLTAALRHIGYSPSSPWISYRARRELARLIRPNWQVIEFGSGSSTAWLVQRCGFIHSIESDPPKYGFLAQRLFRTHKNLRYELRDALSYADLSDYADSSIDFALVGGEMRDECVANVLRTIKAGGLVYLANSDRAVTTSSEEWRAERLLYQAVKERGGMVRYFVDFAPAMAAPNQGMLVSLS